MNKVKPVAKLVFDEEQNCYQCQGSWSIINLDELRNNLNPHLKSDTIVISGAKLDYFDSAGALTLHDFVRSLKEQGKSVKLIDFSKQQKALLKLIDDKQEIITYKTPAGHHNNFLYRTGQETVKKLQQTTGFIALVGDLAVKLLEALRQWRRFRLPSIASNIDTTGIQALPIIALLSCLIGVVLAYQMGLQLQTYGANNFIAYLSGMAIFREFSPLITAIIVAGRTSSAFTAQIGSMKINEEVDAILTMGLSPTELLVVPKVIALLIVFPLLIFWSDFFSILGAMVMSKWKLNIGYYDFLVRLKESVGVKQLLLGLYKAPAFALITSLVGCFQGFLVQSNADSIGTQTTKSVVQALFLIIVADAIFSILYSWMGV
ncbi:putative ABC transport system permease [Legionella beliardensis]|uniref:Putative ABC transport system permease n=1 Tax=Legionella beliardensis TaxID=91822 RepID=A0A378I477_9GAMM|nr:MlaE family lipid ABC transporter permease subunit [Legionella beliardensis]STX29803.1 putative ABC transport system permease [Legionella beliardensis]